MHTLHIHIPTWRLTSFLRIYKIFFLWIAVLVFGTIFLYEVMRIFFSLEQVQVVAEHVQIEINPAYLGQNLLTLQEKDLEQSIAGSYPQIEHVRVSKIYPHTLRIELMESPAVARFRTPAQELYISGGGILYAKGTGSSQLPLISSSSPDVYADGATVKEPWMLFIVTVLKNLQGYVQVAEVQKNEDDSVALRFDNTSILLRSTDDPKVVTDTLQALISSFRIKGSMPIRVDLRFEKPVVVY